MYIVIGMQLIIQCFFSLNYRNNFPVSWILSGFVPDNSSSDGVRVCGEGHPDVSKPLHQVEHH